MNKVERIKKENKVLESFNIIESSNIDKVRINSNNTYEHELFKFKLAYLCKKKGFRFLVEPRFKKGEGQPDFVILDISWIIEILNSEKLSECEEKVKKYPEEFTIKIIDSKKEFPEDLI